MKYCYSFFFLLLLPAIGFSQNTPTWSGDIACLMYSHCTTCHRTGGIAPFSLMTYQETYNRRNSIQYAVSTKYMPPWPPDKSFSRLAHERGMSDAEISMVQAWVAAGAPQGNATQAPTPPVYTSDAEISSPSLSVQIPTYTVPSLTSDLYRCFVLPLNQSTNKFITGFEIIPGNRSIVHHVLVFQDNSSTPDALDAADPGPGYTSFGGVGSNSAKLIGGWVPGTGAYFAPNNMGIKLDANAKLIVQIHYPSSSSGKTDFTKVNFKLTDTPLRELGVAPVLNHSTNLTNGPLYIPANTVKTFHEQFTIPVNATITNIAPHSHLICTSMKAFGITLTGDTIKLINIPKWDFHWQGFYNFKKAIKIPAGTTLHGYATYDNTTNNHHNPNNPPRNVSLGEATTDEMMLFYFSFTGYQNGDENIVIDDSNGTSYYNNCRYATPTQDLPNAENQYFQLQPNPSRGSMALVLLENANNYHELNYKLYDKLGRLVKTEAMPHHSHQHAIDLNGLAKGIFFLTLYDGGTPLASKKVMVY